MRSFKKLAVLVAVFALSAIGAANASAATFTASATGTLSGKATNTQVFTTNAGQVKCTSAATSGSITSTEAATQHVTVNYTGCTAFGFIGVDISAATYLFNAGGTVDIVNPITINVTGAGCHQTVPAQKALGTVTYTTNGSKLVVAANVTKITYTATGGLCGSGEATNGTYSGSNEVERVGGGSIGWDK